MIYIYINICEYKDKMFSTAMRGRYPRSDSWNISTDWSSGRNTAKWCFWGQWEIQTWVIFYSQESCDFLPREQTISFQTYPVYLHLHLSKSCSEPLVLLMDVPAVRSTTVPWRFKLHLSLNSFHSQERLLVSDRREQWHWFSADQGGTEWECATSTFFLYSTSSAAAKSRSAVATISSNGLL